MADLASPATDLGRSYAAGVQGAQEAAALARLQEFVVPETGERIMLPQANGQVIDVFPRGDGSGGLGSGSGGGVGAGQGPGVGDGAAPPAADRAGFMGDVVDALGRVGRNVGDAARQTLNAPFAALREMFRAADDIGTYLAGTAPVTDAEATLGANPARVIARNIPQLADPPDTPAGAIAADVAQFLAGFIGGGRVVRGLAGGAATSVAGQAGQGLAAGAIADFFANDPNQARLAELWQKAGLPATALTEYLADRGDDTAAEARLKRSVEGGVTGAAVEALIAAARGFRAVQAGRQVAQPAAAQQQAQAQQMVTGALAPLGNPDPAAPLIARDVMGFAGAPPSPASPAPAGDAGALMARAAGATSDPAMGVPSEVAARGLAGAADDAAGMGPAAQLAPVENTSAIRAARDTGPVFINWARIQAPEDVQAVIRDTADAFRGDINAAGRDVQSNAETSRLADTLGVTVEDLLSRAPGQPWNAEMALAARRIMVASGEKLAELARAAAAPNASPADAWAFRRMLATHYAIQAEVLAARRETARALQSWAIPAGSAREQQRAIEMMLEQSGGQVTAKAMAERLNALTAAGASPAQVGAYARTAAMASRIGGAVQEAWINALLSSPKTHMVNVMSNSFNAALAVIERRAAEALPGSDVEAGEAGAMVYGMVTGLRDAFRLAGQTWSDGGQQLGAMLGKVDVPHERAISAQAFGVDPGSGLGRGLDFLGHSIVNAPSRALGAEDAFFKSVLYRMEVHAGALRMARQEATAAGFRPGSADFAREVSDRMRVMLTDPPEALRLQAADMALYSTFNRQAGPWAQGLLGLRERIPGTVFILPFIRTPMNILSYSFERTPLAPLVGQWRADVAAGGARRDLALARVSMGTLAMAAAFDMADRGEITGRGPDDPGEVESLRNQGWQPYSVRVGDRWVSYNRLDPFGFTLGFAADFADMLRRRQVEPEEVDEADEILAAGIATVARSVVDKTWMQGVSALIQALDRPEQGTGSFLNQMAGSFVPAVVGQAATATKPEGSLVTNPAEAVLARIPVLADSLPPRRNRWGEVMRPETTGRAIFDAFSPIQAKDLRESPVDAELQRLNLNVARLGFRQEFFGATVNLRDYPRAYDDLVRLAGNDWKNPATGLGLRDALAEMIAGEGPLGAAYERQADGEEGGKAMMIQAMIRSYRQAARSALLEMPEHRDLAALVQQRRAEGAERMQPPEMR